MEMVSTNVSLNADTKAALEEIKDMKAHPENYKSYASFQELLDEVFTESPPFPGGLFTETT